MALKDCIKRMEKAGRPLKPDQLKALEQAKDEGLSDNDAIRRVSLMAHQNIVDIAGRARNEGATLAPVANPLTDLAKFQASKLVKIVERKAKINAELEAKANRFEDIVDAEAFITANIMSMLRKDGAGIEVYSSPIDLSDDKLVLDAMLQFQFRPELNYERLGITGESANDMLDSFREQQAEKATIIDEIHELANELGRIDKQVNVIFSGTGDQTFYQLAPGAPKLTVRHNLSAENLIFTDNLGGLAVPSLSVLPEDQPMTGFGEITMIGTEELGDPSSLPIFDADGYTVRFPSAEYSKAKASDMDPIIKEMVVWERIIEGKNGDATYYIERHMRDHPNPQLVVWKMLDSPAAQAWFLREIHGENLKPEQRDVKPRFRWGWDDELVEFFANAPSPEQWVWEDPKRQQLLQDAADMVRKVAVRSLMQRERTNKIKYTKEEAESVFESGAFLNRDGTLSETRFRELSEDSKRKDTTEIAELATRDMLNARLDQGARRSEFKAWVEAKIVPAMGEGHLKISGKKVPYNLENIVRKMKGKLRGTEEGFALMGDMTEGLMRALASHRFKRLEEMRSRSEVAIAAPDEVKMLRDAAQAQMLAFSSQMPQFYDHTDHTGYVDYHEAEDAARRGIVKWATQYGMGTADDMATALESQGFSEIPEWLVDEAMVAAMDWLAVPVPYFEAKPQRAVMLEEFAGAVIPSDASAETRAILLKRGIPIKEYQVGDGIDNIQTRNDAVSEFTQELNNQGERTLYQSEIGLTSGLLTAARTMPYTKTMKDGVEVGTDGQQILNTLKKQPNVKQAEIDAIGVEEWAKAMGSFTQDQLIEFIDQNGVQLEETFYQGKDDFPTVGDFVPVEDSDLYLDEDGEVQEGVTVYDTQILNYNGGATFTVIEDTEAGNVSVQNDDTGEYLDLSAPLNEQKLIHAEEAIDAYLREEAYPGAAGQVRWTQWALPEGDRGPFGDLGNDINHREIVLNVPEIFGHKYTMEDISEGDVNDIPGWGAQQGINREGDDKYWILDLKSPLVNNSPSNKPMTRVKTIAIAKKDHPTLEGAKQFVVDHMPEKASTGTNFTSHAFSQKNIIAWMRVNDRMGAKGERILFIEEVQSDLHQAGLTDGYNYTDAQKERSYNELEALEVKAAKMLQNLDEPFVGYDNGREALRVYRADMADEISGTGFRDPFENLTKKQHTMMRAAVAAWYKNEKIQTGGPTPNMPFKGDAWVELAMKRLIRMAVEQGYDQVAWTNAEQQLERYDIDEYFSRIEWDPRADMLHTYDAEGNQLDNRHMRENELEEVFGAERVLELNRQIDEKRSHWAISPVYLSSKQRSDMTGEEMAFADATATDGPDLQQLSPNDIVLNDDDLHIDSYGRDWLAQNGVAFALVDENGEMVRQAGGDYQMWEYYSGAEDSRDDFAFEKLPELTAVDVVDEEGKGLRRRYDDLMINVTNRALRKLDKSVKVKRLGIQMEGGGTVQGQRLERGAMPTKENPGGGGNIVPGEVDPGAYWVSGWSNENEADKYDRKPISPRFDTVEEAQQWMDNISLGYGRTQHGFDITPQIEEAAMEGQTLFQDRNRGSVTFRGEQGAIIRMSQAKDLSTFLHEAAHLYLEMMGDLAEMPGVDKTLIDDYTKILNYLGVNNRREVGRDQHELFARSFEAYLREGIAPTAELQPLFSTFKGWMIRVYRQLNKLLGVDEQLTDEIRGVFDRLVATEDAISQSENMMSYVQLYQTAEEMGISQEAFDVYKLAMQESHDEAVDHESKKMIKAMQWSQQMWWNDELKKVTAEVRAEAEQMPIYIALAMLQKGKLPDGTDPKVQPFKLDRADLRARYGKSFLKKLPRPFVYAAKGGIDADVAAAMFGFKDANALIDAIIGAPKMEEHIKDESKRRMQALHPDPLNSPELIEEATRAVHNQKRRQILAAELRALRKQQAEDAKIVKATKDTDKREDREAREANKGQVPKRENMANIKAAAAIAAMKIRNVVPNTYLQAEKKAGRLAFEAMERKDYAEAYRQKRAQIMNFEAYRAAIRAKDQAARDHKYLKGFDKKAKRQRMGKAGYLEQIDAILEGIDLRKISLTAIDRERIEGELMAAIDAGEIVTTPDVINALKRSVGTNWRDMTFEEFAGVRDIIKQLEHQARTDLKAIINGEEVIIQESIDAVTSSIIENNKKVPINRRDETGGEAAKRSVREGVGHWLRSSSIARILDKSGFGAITRHVIVPIRRAYVEKLIPAQQKAAEKIAEIYKEHYTNDELTSLGKPLDHDTMGEAFSKADILALALNWGSESNREAVLGGVMVDEHGNESPAYTQEGVAQALANMDARDWAFVQDMWDYQNSYWEQLAETEKRRRGIAPEKIEALAFEVRTVDGDVIQVKGGYHPLRYDHRHPAKGQTRQEKASEREAEFQDYFSQMLTGGYISTSTRAGATHERTKKSGRVVRLSLTTIDTNLRELIRDMSLGDEVNLINRILTSKEVNQAADNTQNAEVLKELRLWLSDAAVGELPAQSVIEKGLSWTRVGFTKSKLAFNVYVTALQLTGIFQSMAVIGSKAYAVGFGKFISNPVDNYKMVMERSAFMQARYGTLQTWDKDVTDTNNYLKSMFGPAPTKFKTAFDSVGHYYFYPIAKMQSVVDVTTWMGAYEAAINDPKILSEEEAVFAADSMVENSQTSGLFSDRSGIERGTLGTRTRQGQFVRLWTTLISYMLAKGNIAYEKGVTTDFKSPAQVVQFATDMVLLFMIEGIASSLLYDRWPGDEDEDETIGGWVFDVTIDSMLSGIPLVREYSAAKYGSGNTPVGAIVKDAFEFVRQAEQGEADEALIKAGIKVTGTLLHLPASQPNRAVEAMFDDDAALYEYFLGVNEE
jgi:hypothetical protein